MTRFFGAAKIAAGSRSERAQRSMREFTKELLMRFPMGLHLGVKAREKTKHSIGYIRFLHDFIQFSRRNRSSHWHLALRWRDCYPCLSDRTQSTIFDRHYVYHPAWAARILANSQPLVHVDISSTLHFASLVSAFIPTIHYDYRPPKLRLDNLSVGAADLLALPCRDGSLESVSCMHVVEHLGLGRYGGSLDPDADLKATAELNRVLAPGGRLLFVVPIGKPKIMFNAHRIYSYDQVLAFFPELLLRDFTLIPDSAEDGGLVKGASRRMAEWQEYGCGCFWLEKSTS